MPTVAGSNIPTPKSWDEFEDIVLSAAKIRWSSPDFYRNGRQGQRQDGVDIFGKNKGGDPIGVQCKNTIRRITVALIEKEIANAASFQPSLAALYIATTAKRDSSIQEVARKLSLASTQSGKFSVNLLFWDDICQDLANDEAAFFKHYPQFGLKKNLPKEHDQKLYEKLSTFLSSDGVIGFLDKQSMAGWSFEDSKLSPLREFCYEWDCPEREFVNEELETLRKAIHTKTARYLSVIDTETFSVGQSADRRSVPQEWELEQPDRFRRVVSELHSLAGEIVTLHGELVRTARKYFVA